MSRRTPKFAIVIVLVLLPIFAAGVTIYQYRIIRSVDGLHLVKKSEPGFRYWYVDISDWTLKDLFDNRRITSEIIKAGKGSSIPHVVEFNHAVDQGIESFKAFSDRYGITHGYNWTVKRMQVIDGKYEISEKIDKTVEDVTGSANELWEEVIKQKEKSEQSE